MKWKEHLPAGEAKKKDLSPVVIQQNANALEVNDYSKDDAYYDDYNNDYDDADEY
ncbi:MAG: hypothetical protein ACYC0N_02895 [Carboxydocellales bacterium]